MFREERGSTVRELNSPFWYLIGMAELVEVIIDLPTSSAEFARSYATGHNMSISDLFGRLIQMLMLEEVNSIDEFKRERMKYGLHG
jgi:hypothetical protein